MLVQSIWKIKEKIVRKQKLSNYLILLYSEISDHNFWIRKLYSNAGTFKICSKLCLNHQLKSGVIVNILAENLNSNDLQVILNHYRNIDGFKRAFANEPDFLLTKPEMEIFVADTQGCFRNSW